MNIAECMKRECKTCKFYKECLKEEKKNDRDENNRKDSKSSR